MASQEARLAMQRDHEKDERWTAVDHYATRHLHPSHSPYYDAINDALRLSQEKGLPNIEVSPLQGKFLATQCQLIDAKNILEVGTLGGVSSIYFASTGADVKVTTIEVDQKHKAVAEEAIANAGLSDRIEVLLGAGVDVVPTVIKEVESGKLPKFDLAFIDADKPNNLNYFNEAIAMTRSRGCIIVDNVVRRGKLADDEAAKVDVSVSGARQVIEAVGKDSRVIGSSLLQTVGEKNYDGFLISVVR